MESTSSKEIIAFLGILQIKVIFNFSFSEIDLLDLQTNISG